MDHNVQKSVFDQVHDIMARSGNLFYRDVVIGQGPIATYGAGHFTVQMDEISLDGEMGKAIRIFTNDPEKRIGFVPSTVWTDVPKAVGEIKRLLGIAYQQDAA